MQEWAAASRGLFLLRPEPGDPPGGAFVRWEDFAALPDLWRGRCGCAAPGERAAGESSRRGTGGFERCPPSQCSPPNQWARWFGGQRLKPTPARNWGRGLQALPAGSVGPPNQWARRINGPITFRSRRGTGRGARL